MRTDNALEKWQPIPTFVYYHYVRLFFKFKYSRQCFWWVVINIYVTPRQNLRSFKSVRIHLRQRQYHVFSFNYPTKKLRSNHYELLPKLKLTRSRHFLWFFVFNRPPAIQKLKRETLVRYFAKIKSIIPSVDQGTQPHCLYSKKNIYTVVKTNKEATLVEDYERRIFWSTNVKYFAHSRYTGYIYIYI